MVTGFNAALLSRELGTKLTGRHIDIELTPFSYPEFLRFAARQPGPESIADYLRRGGLPGCLRTGVIEVLQELVSDVVYKDVAVRHHIRDAGRSATSAFSSWAPPGSASARPGSRRPCASNLLPQFWSTSVILRRRIWRSGWKRIRPRPRPGCCRPKKIYIADTGLAWALKASQSPDWGSMLENVVYWHLRRQSAELFYFDDGEGECDFVARDHAGQWAAAQAAWELTPDNQGREFAGLLGAMQRLGISSGTIVTREQKDFAMVEDHAINVVPAHEYLCG